MKNIEKIGFGKNILQSLIIFSKLFNKFNYYIYIYIYI